MKTHLLCAVALGLAGIAASASAQDSDSFTIRSNVTSFCSHLSNASSPLVLGELIGLDGLVTPTFAAATSTSYSVPGYYCNAPATMTVEAKPLLNTGVSTSPSSDFTTRVDYLASLVWDNVSAQANTAAAAAGDSQSAPSTEANIGALTLTVSQPAATLRPVAGAYAGSVILKITLP